jgi:hypothetical protein
MIMTQDKARKAAIRQRMAETGEPYSVARGAIEPGARGPAFTGITPEERYAREAQAAGVTSAELQAHLAATSAQERADLVQDAADRAQERADQAEEKAEQAAEQAEAAQEAAELVRRGHRGRPAERRGPTPAAPPLAVSLAPARP